jgi:hypothetical protein
MSSTPAVFCDWALDVQEWAKDGCMDDDMMERLRREDDGEGRRGREGGRTREDEEDEDEDGEDGRRR